MANDVENNGTSTMKSLPLRTEEKFNQLITDLRGDIHTYMDQMVDAIDEDYTNVIVGDIMKDTEIARKEIRALLAAIEDTLSKRRSVLQ